MLAALAFAALLPAAAASLPGVSLPFTEGPGGRWTVSADVPPAFAQAGVQPGWELAAVEGRPFDDPLRVQRQVAAGPARDVQLLFLAPPAGRGAAAEEVLVVVRRAELIRVAEIGVLPWPEGFAREPDRWQVSPEGAPLLIDGQSLAWALDPATGAQTQAPTEGSVALEIPEVWWSLSGGDWVVDSAAGLASGSAAWAREQLAGAARLRSFQGSSGDHLAVPAAEGLRILAVEWPRGTPDLPDCAPAFPEACLAAGKQVQATLIERPGGREEALRLLGAACEGGVHRGCFEAVALEEPALAAQAAACTRGDTTACHALAKGRLDQEPDRPSPLAMGLLEYACQVDASGTLGERLRRLEDVGEGCVMLASAYDRLEMADRALLSLDQACVLGRADACEEAGARRHNAFALRTVRECEDPELPIAAACVELGRLLQVEPVAAASLDDFSAFLRGCSLGEEEGCVLLGDYVDRWGIDNPRVAQAERDLRASCGQGEQRACLGAAYLLVRHEPRSQAYAEALRMFDGACDQGLASACIAGARQRRIGQARRVDAPDQDAMWQSACDKHSAPGCFGLGERQARAKSTWDEAFAAWTRACDLGDAGACTALGRLVQNRHDPAWPEEQAPDLYLTRGCENGDPAGCYWLAEDEIPRKGDPPEPAYVLLERSCQGSYGQGCADLAQVHLDRDTNFDEEIAARHLGTACENGHFESCRVLGGMYLRGRGVERDRERARELEQRFRVNAQRRHVRFGPRIGFPSVVGGELELVLPIPAGPAISVAGSGSYLPGLGEVMVLLEGDSSPAAPPDLQFVSGAVRLYPNNKARGIYGAVGAHRLSASGGDPPADLERVGLSALVGLHSDSRRFYTNIELGMAQYGMIYLKDFDEDESGSFPLIQPTFGLTFGISLF